MYAGFICLHETQIKNFSIPREALPFERYCSVTLFSFQQQGDNRHATFKGLPEHPHAWFSTLCRAARFLCSGGRANEGDTQMFSVTFFTKQEVRNKGFFGYFTAHCINTQQVWNTELPADIWSSSCHVILSVMSSQCHHMMLGCCVWWHRNGSRWRTLLTPTSRSWGASSTRLSLARWDGKCSV